MNISYTRNHLSEVLARVRGGETVLIMDRKQPVARLEPVAAQASGQDFTGRSELMRRGLIRPAQHSLDVKALGAMTLPTPSGKGNILEILLAEREDGR